MQIRLVCIGNLKEKFWQSATEEYKKRLQKFCNLQIIELDEQNKYQDVNKILSEEGKSIIANLGGYNILLDIEGKAFSSEDLANKIKQTLLSSSTITFIIGGSYGVSDEVKRSVQERISFGRITMPHNLARVVALEQFYRAFMINSGAKYLSLIHISEPTRH